MFTTDVIQPIFDLAANPDFAELSQANALSSMDTSPKISNYIFILFILNIKFYRIALVCSSPYRILCSVVFYLLMNINLFIIQ